MSRTGYYNNNINLNSIYQPYSNDLNLSTVCVGNDLRNFSSQFAMNISGPLRIYETIGSGDVYNSSSNGTNSIGTLLLSHGDIGGKSSIIFPSNKNTGSDYGYIIYRDTIFDNTTEERGRLEIGTENDVGSGNLDTNDCLILQKNGGYVGIGTTIPFTTLDVSGTINSNNISTTIISYGTSITLGSSTQTGDTIINANSSTGNIICNSPLYINHSLALSSFNQIGYSYGTLTVTGYTNYSAATTNFKYPSTSSPVPVALPVGVYMMCATVSYNCTAGATAGSLTNIHIGYTAGTASNYSNARTTVFFVDTYSAFFTSANTSRTANAHNQSYTVIINNTFTNYYYAPYIAIVIGTAFTGGTVGANINSWQITRIA